MIELDGLTLVSDLKLPADIVGDDWQLLSVENQEIKAVVVLKDNKKTATWMITFDSKTGAEKQRLILGSNNSRTFFDGRKLYTINKTLATRIDFTTQLTEVQNVFDQPENVQECTQVVALDRFILAIFRSLNAERQTVTSHFLLDKNLRLRDTVTLKKSNRIVYPDSLPRGAVTLFKLKNHEFKLVCLFSSPSVFILTCQIGAKLHHVALQAAFADETRLYTIDTSTQLSRHRLAVQGYGVLKTQTNYKSVALQTRLRILGQPVQNPHLTVSIL